MTDKKTDPALVYPKRPKGARLDGKTHCPTCSTRVSFCTETDDPDETIAANCRFFCEKKDGLKWIDDPRCINRDFIVQIKDVKSAAPKSPKKKGYYKKNKKKGVSR